MTFTQFLRQHQDSSGWLGGFARDWFALSSTARRGTFGHGVQYWQIQRVFIEAGTVQGKHEILRAVWDMFEKVNAGEVVEASNYAPMDWAMIEWQPTPNYLYVGPACMASMTAG